MYKDYSRHVTGPRVSPHAQQSSSFFRLTGMRLSSVPSSIHPLEAVRSTTPLATKHSLPFERDKI